MTREMPKIKRTRKLVITEKQAAGSRENEDIVGQGNVDEGENLVFLRQLSKLDIAAMGDEIFQTVSTTV